MRSMNQPVDVPPTMKLDFSKLSGLYGREGERDILKEVFDQSQDVNHPAQVVLVHGYAGSGKSTLIQRTLKQWAPIYAEGSYQQYAQSSFSAVMEIYKQLKEHPIVQTIREQRRIQQQQQQQQQIDDETSIDFGGMEDQLSQFGDSHSLSSSSIFYDGISVYSQETDVFSAASGHWQQQQQQGLASSNHSSMSNSNYGGLARLKSSFREFVRSVCSPNHPVVIVQDNLQYADAASLEIWKHLAMDKRCHGLIVVGIYRDNQVTSVLKGTIVSLLKKNVKKQQHRRLTRIEMGDLELDAVNEMVADITHFPRNKLDKTLDLAQVVHRKTHGNVFFVIQFLRVLQDEGLLYLNLASYRWEWKIGEIVSKTSLSDNVVDLVANKIQKFPPRLQHTLKMAACLGIKFDLPTLAWVCQMEGEEAELQHMLHQAMESMLLERCWIDNVTEGYRFGHERIQQVAYGLVRDDHERNHIHLDIGRRLRYLIKAGVNHKKRTADPSMVPSSSRTPPWLILAAADQLNAVYPPLFQDRREILDLVSLNIAAADRVMERSAFFPARNYLLKALSLLPPSPHLRWRQHYNLSLNITSKLTGIECSLGRFSDCERLVKEIKIHASKPLDSINALFAEVESYSSQGRIDAAMDLCGQILQQWGEPLLQSKKFTKTQVTTELGKTKWILKGKSDDDILALAKMNDDKINIIHKVYCKLAHLAWWAGQMELSHIVRLRAMRLNVQHGLNQSASYAFALYSSVLSMLGHDESSIRFGRLAQELVDTRPETRRYCARTIVPVHSFSHHITRPLHESMDVLLYAYKMGMETGDCPFAFLAATTYASIYFVCGLPLRALQDDLKSFSSQMASYNQHLSGNMLQVYWQTVLNFMGRSHNPLVLTGEAMNEQRLTQVLLQTKQNATLRAIWYGRMVLAFHFGRFDLAAKMADLLFNNEQDNCSSTCYSRSAYMALSFIVAGAPDRRGARSMKIGLQRARKCMKEVEERKVNCHHLVLLVQAEKFACRENSPVEQSRMLYKEAITAATRRGVLHDAALANERLGAYMLGHNETEWGEHYIRNSHKLYDEWGAYAKVHQMERKYQFLMDKNHLMRGSSSSSVGIKGRQRFSFRIAAKHMTLLDMDPTESEGSGSINHRNDPSSHSRDGSFHTRELSGHL